MTDNRWQAGDAYEAFMGRWSRLVARHFLEWLSPATRWRWLDVGCGTGAVTAEICSAFAPVSVIGCDPSAAFIEHAQESLQQPARFSVADVSKLPSRSGGFDAVVSGLVLNLLPNPEEAIKAQRTRAKTGGVVAAYVWDYAEGMELLRRFWDEAIALDPKAAALDEAALYPMNRPEALSALFEAAGLSDVTTTALEAPIDLTSFDDYWSPFLHGSGPAPSYVASLDAPAREALRARLEQRLTPGADGSIRLRARAWAVSGIAR